MKDGVISMGIKTPIIKKNDNLVNIVVESVLKQVPVIKDKDVIGITESAVARCMNDYITIDDIAKDVKEKYKNCPYLIVYCPIYSRNRFAIILRGIARAMKKVYLYLPLVDEVGNVVRNHPFTNMNYDDYYRDICQQEGCESYVIYDVQFCNNKSFFLHCSLHDFKKRQSEGYITLADICSHKCDYGVLGSNKVDENTLKLFPNKAECNKICQEVKDRIGKETGKDVIVMVYGDGCYKDIESGIWEMADPVCCPGCTNEELLYSTPNELKVKALVDNQFKCLEGELLTKAVECAIANKDTNLVGSMDSQGTTPRRYVNLLTSLMDLTSGSGDRCTPVVYVQNYF